MDDIRRFFRPEVSDDISTSDSNDVLSTAGQLRDTEVAVEPEDVCSYNYVDVSISESSNVECSNFPSTFTGASLPCDLSTPTNDIHKREIVLKGPFQPRNCLFPKRKYSNGNLSFRPDWYDIKEAKGWLEYSPSSDRMYCLPCRLFENEIREKNEPNWITTGVFNWKKAVEKIRNHYKSTQHKWAENAREMFLRTSGHVDVMLDRSRENEILQQRQEIEENRHYLARLVDVAKTLAKCGLPFRGHDERSESNNRGNFLEIVGLLSRWDPVFAGYIENTSRNCMYLSNRAQNDFISAMGEEVVKKIVEDIKSAEIFTVMMDETTDVSGKEQVTSIIRFVDKDEVIQERLISFNDVSQTDSETLFKLLRDNLLSHGLEMSQICGQCYDGASNMSGQYRGVQARVKEEAPKAVYVHCYAHCLNLVLVESAKLNKMARNFFGTLEALYCFVRQSTYRHALFRSLQAQFEGGSEDATSSCGLKKLCETRWACRFEAIKAVEANLPVILQVCAAVEDESSNAKATADARGLHVQMVRFEFLLAMVVLKQLLEHTNILSKYLQSKQIDLGAAVSSVKATLGILKKYRDAGKFHEHFEAAEALANRLGAIIPTPDDARKRRVSQRLDQMWQTQHQFESLEEKYKVEFYFQVLDCIIEQIEQRFSQETQQLLLSFSFLQPEKMFSTDDKNAHNHHMEQLGAYYGMDGSALKTEYSVLRETRNADLQRCKAVLDVLKVLHQSGLHRVYRNLYELCRIFCTLPVTTASCERSFSKLTIVKSKIRSTTAQDRLKNLMILSVENDITNYLNFEEVIDRFATLGPRRMLLN